MSVFELSPQMVIFLDFENWRDLRYITINKNGNKLKIMNCRCL